MIKNIAAYRIVDDIRAFAFRKFVNFLDKILAAVVNEIVSTALAANFKFFRVSGMSRKFFFLTNRRQVLMSNYGRTCGTLWLRSATRALQSF